MHLGIDSFVAAVTDPRTERVIGAEERMEHLLEEIALADQVGLHSFGIGEHHRPEYYDSAPPVILAARPRRAPRASGWAAPWPCSVPPTRCGSSSSSRRWT
jgi:alkanesulfonate monooxygenase SsuD/methylene tetrahydromethanopterin reductase-like flavin-dependent oxidoreductase (luciferase family)